jgi:hypothetical protein
MSKRYFKTIVMIGLVALTLSSLSVMAEDESPVSASVDISTLSQYVWRGYALSDDSIVIQPSVTVSYNNLSFNLWGNMDTDDPIDNDTSFNETDMTLSYSWSFDKLTVGAGYLYYALEGEDTQELFVSFGLDTLLTPTLSVYKDIDTFPGWYYNLGISHSIAITDALALNLGASMGYMDTDGYDEFHDGAITASMSYAVNKYLTITPKVAYTLALTDESKDNIMATSWDGDDDHFYGGVSFAVAF